MGKNLLLHVSVTLGAILAETTKLALLNCAHTMTKSKRNQIRAMPTPLNL